MDTRYYSSNPQTRSLGELSKLLVPVPWFRRLHNDVRAIRTPWSCTATPDTTL
jgi:hypothetical protein